MTAILITITEAGHEKEVTIDARKVAEDRERILDSEVGDFIVTYNTTKYGPRHYVIVHSTEAKNARHALRIVQGRLQEEAVARTKALVALQEKEQRREEAKLIAEEQIASGTYKGVVLDAWKCPECEHVYDEEPEKNSYYECQCGNTFSYDETGSHRCEQCNKFAAKAYDFTCEQCQTGIEEWEMVHVIEFEGDMVELDV
jgi:hypothetical protein